MTIEIIIDGTTGSLNVIDETSYHLDLDDNPGLKNDLDDLAVFSVLAEDSGSISLDFSSLTDTRISASLIGNGVTNLRGGQSEDFMIVNTHTSNSYVSNNWLYGEGGHDILAITGGDNLTGDYILTGAYIEGGEGDDLLITGLSGNGLVTGYLEGNEGWDYFSVMNTGEKGDIYLTINDLEYGEYLFFQGMDDHVSIDFELVNRPGISYGTSIQIDHGDGDTTSIFLDGVDTYSSSISGNYLTVQGLDHDVLAA